jgi:creatinine amidohydrolase
VKIKGMNWMQVEEYLARDDRAVLPVGSTEQHAYLSLATDSILAERVAVEAAEPLGVLVLPAMPFGIAPGFAAFPGTVTLRTETFAAVLSEVLETLHGQGFRGFLVVNGHGGNGAAREPLEQWAAGREGTRFGWHDWWDSPDVAGVADRIEPNAAHASWLENFPWTRLEGVDLPSEPKPPVPDREALRELDPVAVRAAIGDGSYGGAYTAPSDRMLEMWAAGVAEVRALIERL